MDRHCIGCGKRLHGSKLQRRCRRCRRRFQAALQRERRVVRRKLTLAERLEGGSGPPCELCGLPTQAHATHHEECRRVVWMADSVGAQLGAIVDVMAARGVGITEGLMGVKGALTTAGNALSRLGAYPRKG